MVSNREKLSRELLFDKINDWFDNHDEMTAEDYDNLMLIADDEAIRLIEDMKGD